MQVLVKISPKENVKLNFDRDTTLKQLHDQICEGDADYFCKNRILSHKHKLVDQGVENGDLIVQIRIVNKIQEEVQKQVILTNAEDYKKKVLELIDLGYRREDVVQAMQQNKYNLSLVLSHLIFGKRRISADEEQEQEQNIDEIKDKLMLIPELKQLIHCIKNPEWKELFYQLQCQNSKVFNEFMQNTMALVELLSELL